MALICDQLSFVNPVVSFSRAIPEGLQYGHQVTVKGMFLPSCGSRFAVNFQTGFSDKDIAFHFNPRFEEGGYVVCNTKQKKWSKKEERMMINPFQVGIPFEISFLVENSGFQVKVNGKDFTKYTHRVPFHRVDTISFTGGVEVTQIRIEDARAVCLQRMISDVQSYPSPCDSPESKGWKPKDPGDVPVVQNGQTTCEILEHKEQKAKPPSYWQAIAAPIVQKVIPGLKCLVSLPAPVSAQPRSFLLVQVSQEPDCS